MHAIARFTLGVRRLLFARVLRARGVRCATPVKFHYTTPRVRNAGSIDIGTALVVRAPVTRTQIEAVGGGRLTIGNDVFLNEGVIIAAAHEIAIGDNANIGDFTTIHDSDFHALTPGRPIRVAPVRIGRNVWLGRNVVVLPGVTIGENAVVGAGSIVTADVARNTLVGGNPARLIRELEINDPAFVRT